VRPAFVVAEKASRWGEHLPYLAAQGGLAEGEPKRDIALSSLQRAAALVGQRVVIELV
jgi:hypothetical protein